MRRGERRRGIGVGFALWAAAAAATTLAACTRSADPLPEGVERITVSWHEVPGTRPLLPLSPFPESQPAAASVMLFLAPDCPISNAYAPEIGRLVDEYGPRGVRFAVVHADPRVSDDVARQHAAEFKLRCPVLLDPKQELAAMAGATVTPEAAVFDPKRGRVYVGRIDDLFYSFGKRRAAPTSHEVRDALDAVLAGQPVTRASAPALGCEIPPP